MHIFIHQNKYKNKQIKRETMTSCIHTHTHTRALACKNKYHAGQRTWLWKERQKERESERSNCQDIFQNRNKTKLYYIQLLIRENIH